MKKTLKKSLFIFTLIISICFFTKVSALTSGLTPADQETSFVTGNVNFSSIKFHTGYDGSISFVGANVNSYNNNNYTVNVNSSIYFYDNNKQLLATAKNNWDIAPRAPSNVIYGETIDVLGSHKVDDISYYSVSSEVTKAPSKKEKQKASEISSYQRYGYVIDKYNVDIKVHENNTFDINETITTYFHNQRHGIIRKIPLKNNIKRLDGSISKNRVLITNLKVNSPYTKSKENGYYNVKIGSASETITGEKVYKISYNYDIGKDPLKNNDEFYFNIIGNEWDTVVGGITFKITMPKSFDESKLGFSAGPKGSLNSDSIIFNVDDKVITGSYDGILKPNEGLNIRLTLDEGYFATAKTHIDYSLLFIIAGLVLLLGGGLLLWYKYGRDEKPIETVEFYPPEGYNSAEIGFLYKGTAESSFVISLMIYLANKEYIKIEEYKNDDFKIIKLKDYDGNNEAERMFMDGLFVRKNEVLKKDLENSFYVVINEICKELNKKQNKEKIFEASSLKKAIFVFGLSMIAYILTIFKPLMEYGGEQSLIILIFPLMMFAIYMSIGTSTSCNFSTIFALLLVGVMGLILPISDVLYNSVVADPFYIILYIIGFGVVAALMILYFLMPKRNKYGVTVLGKIKGFKNFLETAEKEQLEAQVNQNPTYFYDILPYTYVLDVSDVWIKKFESIAIEPPNWYDGSSAFNYVTFSTFMSSTMTSATSAMTSSPHSSSGGSGGGSSGGGSGGGGGSSW